MNEVGSFKMEDNVSEFWGKASKQETQNLDSDSTDPIYIIQFMLILLM